jgi:hypothetical protein
MDQIKRYYEIIIFMWHLIKDYADITVNDDARWTELVDKAAEFGKAHPEKFARRMLNVVLEELNDRAREARKAA